MPNDYAWAERKAIGDAHEDRVRVELEWRGWTVTPYGQGVLPATTRAALRRTESRMRWDPDFVVSHGSAICLVDAKASMHGEDAYTYTISRKALRSGIRMWAELDLPLYYVFQNLGCATPVEIMQFCRLNTIGEAGGYVSFGSGLARPFDDVFGAGSYARIDAFLEPLPVA